MKNRSGKVKLMVIRSEHNKPTFSPQMTALQYEILSSLTQLRNYALHPKYSRTPLTQTWSIRIPG